jgi:phosphoglycolate phosphatase-like HAD superfamily hydrolase
MGVFPAQCLMIGDTTVDIRAGKAAGAQTVGVLCGFGEEAELRRWGADLILPTTHLIGSLLLEGLRKEA